jgi:hypothetical protein
MLFMLLHATSRAVSGRLPNAAGHVRSFQVAWVLWWTKCYLGERSPSSSIPLLILVLPFLPHSSIILHPKPQRLTTDSVVK